MRVQLGLCRICVAVPALFGRGSPFGVGEKRVKSGLSVSRILPLSEIPRWGIKDRHTQHARC